MKKSICLLTVFVVSFFSCSRDENIVEQSTISTEMISPDGYRIAKHRDDLANIVFDKEEIKEAEILSVEFVSINNKDGAIAYVNYQINGESKNLAYVVGNVKVGYKSPNVEFRLPKNRSTYRTSDVVATYKCTGLGCCYVGGSYNWTTDEYTFFCKCEGNPEQNSSCTLQVEKKNKEITPTAP
jgi:hypothetical protein